MTGVIFQYKRVLFVLFCRSYKWIEDNKDVATKDEEDLLHKLLNKPVHFLSKEDNSAVEKEQEVSTSTWKTARKGYVQPLC